MIPADESKDTLKKYENYEAKLKTTLDQQIITHFIRTKNI